MEKQRTKPDALQWKKPTRETFDLQILIYYSYNSQHPQGFIGLTLVGMIFSR